jgi:hypothetical protein
MTADTSKTNNSTKHDRTNVIWIQYIESRTISVYNYYETNEWLLYIRCVKIVEEEWVYNRRS